MAEVQIAIRFRGKPGMHAAPIFIALDIPKNDVANEV